MQHLAPRAAVQTAPRPGAALESDFLHVGFPSMKRFLGLFAAAVLVSFCAACAQGGSAPSSGASGITMYGTIDEGVAVHK